MSGRVTLQAVIDLRTAYEERFGECPVGSEEVGEDELYRLLKQAMDTNTPLPEPDYAELT